MSTDFQRRGFSNFLLTTLRDLDLSNINGVPDKLLVGDMTIPRGGGWVGSPNDPSASFRPYAVLVPMTASEVPMTAGLGPQRDWNVPYGAQSFGVTRDQAELVGDIIRAALNALLHETFTLGAGDPPGEYRCQQITQQTIGGVNRVAGADPAYFGQSDQITFWLGKR